VFESLVAVVAPPRPET